MQKLSMLQELRPLLIVLFLFVSFICKAGDTLVNAGAEWKYLDNGSDQGTAWYQPAFNDSSWLTGYAQFGYGDNDEMTLVSYGSDPNNKFITTYFRSSFSVMNTAVYKGLRLYLKRDDGIVLYVNGVEVYRSNMPSDTITYTTEAQYSIDPGSEEYFILVPLSPAILQNGVNVIAAEVHQSSVTSDDLSFDLMLIGDSEAELMRGPYLQSATPHSMKICYRTSTPEVSTVYYGTSLAYTDSVTDTSLVTDHTVELENLTPSTKYFYSLRSPQKQLAGDSTYYFYSAPDSTSRQPVRIWATGDMGSGNRKQIATRDAYNIYSWNKYTDILLFLGDNAYPFGNDENYTANVFTNHYEDMLKKSVVYSTTGNHDLFSANSNLETGVYYDIFHFPVNGEAGGTGSGKEAYYSFNYSNIHFVSLESNIDSFGVTNASYMISWLQSDLAANTLPWTIVFFHNPCYSKGYHDSDVENDLIYMRQNVNPVLEAYNVDLVLTGHSHDYERSYLLKGHFGNAASFDSTMIVNGSSGMAPFTYNKIDQSDSGTVYAVIGNASELTPVQPDWPHPAMYTSLDSVYGSLVIEVENDTMHVKMLTDSFVIADEFAIVKNITTGIKTVTKELAGFNLYPQPARDELNLYFKSDSEKQVSILNELGQILMHRNLPAGQENIKLDTRQLTPGIYFVKVSDKEGSAVKRFVKN
jgi:predicted MPP superfamily phosphohydrolase